MTRILGIGLCIGIAAGGTAGAQTANPAMAAPGNPATMPPGTVMSAPDTPRPDQVNTSDRVFVHALAIGGMAEIDAGRLASQSAASAPVRQFAERMVQDHDKANRQLADAAGAAKVPLPAAPDSEHESVRQHLEKLHGAAFDRGYIMAQIKEHQETAQLLEYEIGSGQDTRLKQLAADTLPIVLEHLAKAQQLDAAMTGEPLSGADR